MLFYQSETGEKRSLIFSQWLEILETFQPINKKNSKELNNKLYESKYRLLFRIYDNDNDGYIGKSDLTSILQALVGENFQDINFEEIAQRFQQEFESSNQLIDFERFKTVFGPDKIAALSLKFSWDKQLCVLWCLPVIPLFSMKFWCAFVNSGKNLASFS